MAYGIVNQSYWKCLVLRAKLFIFYCRIQGWMSLRFPVFIPPPLLQEFCIAGQGIGSYGHIDLSHNHLSWWGFIGVSIFIVAWLLYVFLWKMLPPAWEGKYMFRNPFSLSCSLNCLGCIDLFLQKSLILPGNGVWPTERLMCIILRCLFAWSLKNKWSELCFPCKHWTSPLELMEWLKQTLPEYLLVEPSH